MCLTYGQVTSAMVSKPLNLSYIGNLMDNCHIISVFLIQKNSYFHYIYRIFFQIMTDMELDVVVVTDNGSTARESAAKLDEVETFKRRLFLFFWERKKAIVFRLLAMVAILFDVYSVWKKFTRGHYPWVCVAVFFLLVTSIIGAIYSLYCEVLEKSSLESPSVSKKEKKSKGKLEDHEKLVASDSVQGFHDVTMTLDYDSDSSTEDSILQDQKPSKAKKKKVQVLRFDDTPSNGNKTSKQRKMKKGTYMQAGIIDPKMEGEEDCIDSAPETSSGIKLSPSKFLSGVKEHCSRSMVLSHIFLCPKEYQFYHVSKILWRHYKEPSHKEATSQIKESHVKEVSFKPLWNEYIYREIISKQLSLLMAVVQTIPMTLIELLYFSIAEFDTDSRFSFLNVNSLSGEQFNILELVSLVINMTNISYRVVSLMNQIRKLNFSKQDMGFFHKIYLTIIYFLLLTSRVITLYFVMCLNVNGIVFTISILCVQFSTTYLVTKNLYEEGNPGTMMISNLLMVFLYVPPKVGRRITMFNYHVIIFIEMIALFVFGHFQLTESISVVGQNLSPYYFYWFFVPSVVVFILAWFLNSELVSKCLFKYREKMSRDEIRKVLRDSNDKFKTDYQLIVGYYGQDKSSFNAQQTIHLF